METIKERADKVVYKPTDGHPLKACEVVAFARGYELGATEQKAIDDECITKLEKEKALLIREVHNKNKRIAKLKATEEKEEE